VSNLVMAVVMVLCQVSIADWFASASEWHVWPASVG